ncbi:LOW QUALITY PROTEIN: hypothetical protein ACHAXT_008430 [Thalassiosira profunda]
MSFAATVAIAAVGALLPPPSHALSSASFDRPRWHFTALALNNCNRGLPSFARRGESALRLRAVVDNPITTEAPRPDADETDIPAPPGELPSLTVVAGPGATITSVSSGVAVEQELWASEDFPSEHIGVGSDAVDYDSFLGDIFQEGESILADITNEYEIDEDAGSESTQLDDGETESEEETSNEGERSSSTESDDSTIRSAMAKSALLHRAGIAGRARKSSRSNGRSSQAKSYVNKRGSGRAQGVGGIGRVLGTVRTAAAAAAKQKESGGDAIPGDGDDNLTTKNALTNPTTWKSAIQSTVADMLKRQDFAVQRQSVKSPPGTTSMGILGDVVREELPTIPPLPGASLVRTSSSTSTSKPQLNIRSSVPHSMDDKQIANLRLSVFSRFDGSNSESFEVDLLNTRRRRGAVVLVAEAPEGAGEANRYPNEMEARIASGHHYGETNGASSVATETSLTVASVRGATITSASAGVGVDQDGDGPIIGSVECSHQEFCGTMLGSSRPKGALLYVTEVAVKTDARRCGAGALLMEGVDEVAALRNVETIYLHVDVTNRAAVAMYEKCGYHYLDKREPVYAQFTASLNLHDGAMHGRKHFLMCKNVRQATWLDGDNYFLFSESREGVLWGC